MTTGHSAPHSAVVPPAEWRCYVINLPSETERKKRIATRLRTLGIEPTFVEGVDGRLLDLDATNVYDSTRHRRWYPRDLSRGEIGCCLAHRKVYERMLDDGCEYALVLEDDAILADDLPQIIAVLLSVSTSWELVVSCIPSPVLPNDAVASCIDTQDDGHRWKTEKHASLGLALSYFFTRGLWKIRLAVDAARLRLGTLLSDRRLNRRLARMTSGR